MLSFLKKYSNKNILIIGGSGFIGTNLAKKLIQLDSKVSLFQRVKIQHDPVFSYYYGDITNNSKLKKIVKQNFDIIFHCAGFSGEINNQNNPEKSIQINYLATRDLLDFIHQYSPTTKTVICSSRLEYGKSTTKNVNENHPTRPIGFYGISKLLSTVYTSHMHQKHNLPVTILRISNVYGSSSPFKFEHYNIINHFINQAKNKKNLIVYGKGNQIRDYLYIDDLINALLLAGISKKANGQIYNVGFGKGIRFKTMVKKIGAQAGVKVQYKSWPADYASVETGNYVSNIKKIKSHLNWQPKISFDQGIKMCFLQE